MNLAEHVVGSSGRYVFLRVIPPTDDIIYFGHSFFLILCEITWNKGNIIQTCFKFLYSHTKYRVLSTRSVDRFLDEFLHIQNESD